MATPFYWLGCYVNILRPAIGLDFSKVLFESVLEILDLTTHTSIFITYYYSVIAAAAFHIRLQSFKWLKYATGYEYEQIRPCVRAMVAFLKIPHALEFPSPEERISGPEFDRIIVRNNSILKQLLVQQFYEFSCFIRCRTKLNWANYRVFAFDDEECVVYIIMFI